MGQNSLTPANPQPRLLLLKQKQQKTSGTPSSSYPPGPWHKRHPFSSRFQGGLSFAHPTLCDAKDIVALSATNGFTKSPRDSDPPIILLSKPNRYPFVPFWTSEGHPTVYLSKTFSIQNFLRPPGHQPFPARPPNAFRRCIGHSCASSQDLRSASAAPWGGVPLEVFLSFIGFLLFF